MGVRVKLTWGGCCLWMDCGHISDDGLWSHWSVMMTRGRRRRWNLHRLGFGLCELAKCTVNCHLKWNPSWLLIINYHRFSNLKHFTYVQLPCSSLAVSPGWCPQRTWWTASLQRRSGSKTPEVSTLYSPPLEICQIFLSAKKILISNASPSTLRGTTSWRSSIGIFLTTVLKDSDTVDFDSNSSTECSNTKTPLKPYVICKEDKVGPKECEGHWETYIMINLFWILTNTYLPF